VLYGRASPGGERCPKGTLLARPGCTLGLGEAALPRVCLLLLHMLLVMVASVGRCDESRAWVQVALQHLMPLLLCCVTRGVLARSDSASGSRGAGSDEGRGGWNIWGAWAQ